jgi:hypothetical protein
MNLQPPASYPREINVVGPITPACERVQQMLFKPFDLAKWITLGFCAWLAGLGESGGGGSYGYNGDNHGGNQAGQPLEQFRHFYHAAGDYMTANLVWIVPLAIFLVLAGVALWVLVLWLSSRGKFMFLHCVALDKAEVEVPWRQFAGAANRLLRFRVVLGLIAMGIMLPLLGLAAIVILRMVLRGEADAAGVVTALALGLAFVFLALVLTVIRKFMVDFVVPIMFLRGGGCWAAWREFYALLSANVANFALYILFQIVLTMAIGIIVLLAILATCCIAGCLLLLPFLGTVLLLPVLVFKRAYPLYYLAQYGPQYDVFPVPPALPSLPAQPPVAG